ncbi:MAG: hypothetical protein M1819_005042 [Sarea resinae]|nr:MAG: hypothetical protein M1819_005042 [Sarea resinae]
MAIVKARLWRMMQKTLYKPCAAWRLKPIECQSQKSSSRVSSRLDSMLQDDAAPCSAISDSPGELNTHDEDLSLLFEEDILEDRLIEDLVNGDMENTEDAFNEDNAWSDMLSHDKDELDELFADANSDIQELTPDNQMTHFPQTDSAVNSTSSMHSILALEKEFELYDSLDEVSSHSDSSMLDRTNCVSIETPLQCLHSHISPIRADTFFRTSFQDGSQETMSGLRKLSFTAKETLAEMSTHGNGIDNTHVGRNRDTEYGTPNEPMYHNDEDDIDSRAMNWGSDAQILVDELGQTSRAAGDDAVHSSRELEHIILGCPARTELDLALYSSAPRVEYEPVSTLPLYCSSTELSHGDPGDGGYRGAGHSEGYGEGDGDGDDVMLF